MTVFYTSIEKADRPMMFLKGKEGQNSFTGRRKWSNSNENIDFG